VKELQSHLQFLLLAEPSVTHRNLQRINRLAEVEGASLHGLTADVTKIVRLP
jgi:hypothetical protein